MVTVTVFDVECFKLFGLYSLQIYFVLVASVPIMYEARSIESKSFFGRNNQFKPDEDGKLLLRPFIDASRDLVKFIDLLGPLFMPVSKGEFEFQTLKWFYSGCFLLLSKVLRLKPKPISLSSNSIN